MNRTMKIALLASLLLIIICINARSQSLMIDKNSSTSELSSSILPKSGDNNSLQIGDKKLPIVPNKTASKTTFFMSQDYIIIGKDNDTYYGKMIAHWPYGPGRRVLIIRVHEHVLGIGTDLGVVLVFLNGSRINSMYLNSSASYIGFVDIQNDGASEYFVGAENGLALCYDLKGNVVFNITLPERIILMDWQNFLSPLDKSLIIVSENHINAYSINDSLQFSQYIPDDIQLATVQDLDSDNLVEIVLGTVSGYVYVLTKDTTYTNYLGVPVSSLYVYDWDDDTYDEIFVGTVNGALYILSHTCSLIRKTDLSPKSLVSVIVNDFDNDNDAEISALDESGYVTILNSSYKSEWTYNFSVTSLQMKQGQIMIGDPPELVVVSSIRLICFGYNSTASNWQTYWNYATKYDLLSIDIADIDNDFVSEIAYGGLSENVTLLENDTSAISDITYTIYGTALSVSDIDNDGLKEFAITSNEGELFAIDDDYEILWRYYIGENASEIVTDDLDSDGSAEILVSCLNNTVIGFYINKSIIMKYNVGSIINHVLTADLNGDSEKEIIIASSSGAHILNMTGHLQKIVLSNNNVTSIAAGNVAGDDRNELVLGLSNGSLVIYDYLYDNYVATHRLNIGAITRVLVHDIVSGGNQEILVSSDNGYIMALNASQVLWQVKNNYGVVDIRVAIADAFIIANYRKGLLALNFSGSMIWNLTYTDSPIIAISSADVTGDTYEEISFLISISKVLILNNTSNALWSIGIQLFDAKALDTADLDHNFVSELVLSGPKGLAIVKSVPELWITYPENSSQVNTRNISVTWKFNGIAPYIFEIYLDSTIIDRLYGPRTRYLVSLPSDGYWTITIKCIPKSGRSLTSHVDIYVDSTPPDIRILYPENNTFTKYNSVTLRWYGSDNESGIDHYEVRKDNLPWINVNGNESYVFENLSYGIHSLWVKAVDKLGNENVTYIVIFIDTVAPTLSIVTPENDSYINSPNVTVSWTYEEENLDFFNLYVNGELYYHGENTSYTVENLEDGNYSIRVECFDLAGNNFSQEIIIHIDTQIPRLEVLEPKNNTIINNSVIRIKLDFSDENIMGIFVRVNNSDWIDFGLNKTVNITLTGEGYYTIEIKALDLANNVNLTRITILLDTTPPHISIDYPSNNTYFNKSYIEIRWNGSDNLSGIQYYEVRVDNNAWIRLGNLTSFRLTELPDGAHIIWLRAVDRAGNIVVTRVIVHIDTKAPVIRIISPINGTITNSSTIVLLFDYQEENLVYFEVYLNNELVNVTKLSILDLRFGVEGAYWIRVVGYDMANNSGEATVYVLYDSSPPVITILTDVNGTSFTNGSFIVSWSGYDAVSGIASYYISIDYGDYINLGLTSVYEVDLTELSLGEHTIIIMAYDKAGNAAKVTLIFYKIREELPPPTVPITLIAGIIAILALIAIVDIYLFVIKKKRSQ